MQPCEMRFGEMQLSLYTYVYIMGSGPTLVFNSFANRVFRNMAHFWNGESCISPSCISTSRRNAPHPRE
ncbi:hypothetical protein H8356DRAFT_1338177 [Neocallimastix lanati (nom. inval.)]|nr:hypothetical protein H8356DRAFT_1338177 [Neocallimastix sp. JGI-2020a]